MAIESNLLGIVIPLKAEVNSRNWAVTSDALRLTLEAIAGQTSKNHCCTVVGHTKPELEWEHFGEKNIRFDRVRNFEAVPFLSWSAHDRQQAITKDKNTKILQGVTSLTNQATKISHWFALDADDIIANDFVSSILTLNPQMARSSPVVIPWMSQPTG